MAETAPFIERRKKKKESFVARNAAMLVGLLIVTLFTALVLGFLLVSARNLQEETLKRIDQPVNGHDLPGPKGQISQRSMDEVSALLSETPRVLGGWVAKLNYEKTEDPIIHFWARSPLITKFVETYHDVQVSGKGYSSAELNAANQQSLRNSEEAKTGLIKCGALTATNLPKLAPGIEKFAKGVCRSTIPPFSEGVNLSIVVVTDVPGDQNSPEIQEIRRVLLQLQLDVFNRDYQGRETWARQTPPVTPTSPRP